MNHDNFFLQSGELVDLGSGELRSLVRTYRPDARITELGRRLVLVDKQPESDLRKIAARAAFTRLAGSVLRLTEDDKITGFELDGVMGGAGTFACRLVNLSAKSLNGETLAELGGYIKQKAPWLRVSLDAPDLTFVVIATDTASLVGLVRHESERGRGRSRTRERAYFHPVALKPKLGRAMINLAMVREGDAVLDPFCGTGGIMLEALQMRMRAIGCDLSQKMCRGAVANLAGYDGSFLANGDACALPFRLDRIDAVVTDLPYGRASSTQRRSPRELLSEFLHGIGVMKGKRYCVMCRKGDEQEFPGVVEEYDVYEHRSLTRKLMVICS